MHPSPLYNVFNSFSESRTESLFGLWVTGYDHIVNFIVLSFNSKKQVSSDSSHLLKDVFLHKDEIADKVGGARQQLERLIDELNKLDERLNELRWRIETSLRNLSRFLHLGLYLSYMIVATQSMFPGFVNLPYAGTWSIWPALGLYFLIDYYRGRSRSYMPANHGLGNLEEYRQYLEWKGKSSQSKPRTDPPLQQTEAIEANEMAAASLEWDSYPTKPWEMSRKHADGKCGIPLPKLQVPAEETLVEFLTADLGENIDVPSHKHKSIIDSESIRQARRASVQEGDEVDELASTICSDEPQPLGECSIPSPGLIRLVQIMEDLREENRRMGLKHEKELLMVQKEKERLWSMVGLLEEKQIDRFKCI